LATQARASSLALFSNDLALFLIGDKASHIEAGLVSASVYFGKVRLFSSLIPSFRALYSLQ